MANRRLLLQLLTPSSPIRPWLAKPTSSNNLSTTTTTSDTHKQSDSSSSSSSSSSQIKKSVFISQSHDVFTNLALEDWIYRNYDFAKHHVLMLWINDPCVVIGRHQNPFSEVANVSDLARKNIALARRNSGGGTVYHDAGNLNCTFFTARERYNRRYNLNLITRALFREWSIKADISERDDILLRGKKVLTVYLCPWCHPHNCGLGLCSKLISIAFSDIGNSGETGSTQRLSPLHPARQLQQGGPGRVSGQRSGKG